MKIIRKEMKEREKKRERESIIYYIMYEKKAQIRMRFRACTLRWCSTLCVSLSLSLSPKATYIMSRYHTLPTNTNAITSTSSLGQALNCRRATIYNVYARGCWNTMTTTTYPSE